MIPTSCCRTPAAVLSLLSCSANRLVTSVCALPKASKEKDASSCVRAPHPHTLVHFTDVIAPSSMPWGLQGPEIYRSHLHMARHLTDRRFFFSCHFTLPMQTILYLYCTDPVTLCICYLRRNLSVFDRAALFFLCKFLFTWPFLPDVVRFLSPGFGVVVQGRVLTEDGGTME